MKQYIKADEWNIVEEGFDPDLNKISESIFSIGNGLMGQRANFEETYSGETFQGNYLAGIYFPDKTRVGWWKNGYPEYFAKILNAANWIGLEIVINGEILDLSRVKVDKFRRTLNMKAGFLHRTFEAEFVDGKKVHVSATRFCSIANDEIAAMRYEITALNFSGNLSILSFSDGDVSNQDSNYDEKFWEEENCEIINNQVLLGLRTRKTNFQVCTGTRTEIVSSVAPDEWEVIRKNKFAGLQSTVKVKEGETISIRKIATNLTSENYPAEKLFEIAQERLMQAELKGFEKLMDDQAVAMAEKWATSDIIIEGDISAQQAIRFNIFQLNQTYTGKDPRLNIGPKGFTGEKYGGLTYWDTEAYCVPYYLATAPQEVSKNLLIYRHRQLQKAIENAEKLGFTNGAALYPMVTINGEECHNEWEITFEEIHRNGAIAFAIYNYIRYTGDSSYLSEYGLEVLIAISRFWAQRVNQSALTGQYMILGVTGPNEYENNVNNNWYTNLMARWCLQYTIESLASVKASSAATYLELLEKTALKDSEPQHWEEIIRNMYFPESKELGVFLQQDGYLDKEQTLVAELAAEHRPLNQKWSWDRILRSCFIKQADVLQGIYFFEDDYELDVIKRNFDFYESRTVHESSLSPCIHCILAARLSDEKRAYEFYLRTARLDLDDYNNDTEDGLHITSMAGTWMSITEGFAGMKVRDDILHFSPFLPEQWKSFSFTVTFRGTVLTVRVEKDAVMIKNLSDTEITVRVHGSDVTVPSGRGLHDDYKINV